MLLRLLVLLSVTALQWDSYSPDPWSFGADELWYWTQEPKDLTWTGESRWRDFLSGDDSAIGYPEERLAETLEKLRSLVDEMRHVRPELLLLLLVLLLLVLLVLVLLVLLVVLVLLLLLLVLVLVLLLLLLCPRLCRRSIDCSHDDDANVSRACVYNTRAVAVRAQAGGTEEG